ncbi:MAG: hypothetical protein AAB840_02275 [Patescibacteria group bacterium]
MTTKEVLQTLCSHIIGEGDSKDRMTTNRQYAEIVNRNQYMIENLCLRLTLSEIIEIAESFDHHNRTADYLLHMFCEIIAGQVGREVAGNELDRFALLIRKLNLEDLDNVLCSFASEDATRCIMNEYDRRGVAPHS